MASAKLSEIRRIENERSPELDALVVNVESARHDADDGSRPDIDRDLLTDDRAPAECRLPEVARDHDDRGSVGECLRVLKRSPGERRNGHRGEEAGRGAGRRHAARAFVGPDVY